MLALWLCAIDQTAALSLASLTLRPVEMRLCVSSNLALVALRFCRATNAAVLVLTLTAMSGSEPILSARVARHHQGYDRHGKRMVNGSTDK